jgi:hypothetical protein
MFNQKYKDKIVQLEANAQSVHDSIREELALLSQPTYENAPILIVNTKLISRGFLHTDYKAVLSAIRQIRNVGLDKKCYILVYDYPLEVLNEDRE